MLELICTDTCNTCRHLVRLLERDGIVYRYREYRKEPLSVEEIRRVLALLGLGPREVLRRHDRAFRDLKLTGGEPDDELIRLMSEHPTLLQRPIGIFEGRAIIGRPPQKVLELVGMPA